VATNVIEDGGVVPAPAEPATPPRAPQHRRLYRRRFLVAYLVLAAALGATVAGIVLALGSTIGSSSAGWSSWKPADGGISGAREIAQHVSPLYRLPSGKQLVDVIAKAPSVSPGNQVIPVHYLAIRGTGGKQDTIVNVDGSNTVMYSLCGLGPSCSIATGTASVERGRLVRREILELALYTFKYLGLQNIVAFMPPRPGSQPQYVVYLTKSDLSAELNQPLDRTLSPHTPLPNTIPAREVRTVDATTESKVFSYSLSQAQQGDAILVLAPLPA